jgi:hypothetical protein
MVARSASSQIALAVAATALLFGQGCTLETSPDGSEFSAAVPQAQSVRVASPSAPGVGASGVAPAQWYDYTRRATDDVNEATKGVIGNVFFIAHTIPSEVAPDFARWGPFTLFDDPVAWRLIIERAEGDGFHYRLDGRPHASTSEQDFRTVFDGEGYGAGDERHGDGRFTIYLDAAHQLDPERFDADGGGKVTFVHDLPADIDENEDALPRKITALIDSDGDAWATLVSTAEADGSGQLELIGLVDTDAADSALEDAAMLSRWRGDGAGRADVTLAQGDTPGGGAALTITECWGGDAARVFYTDSRGVQPVFGDAAACVE